MGFKVSKLKVDPKKENEGVWFPYRDGSSIKVASMQSPRYLEAVRKIGKPYRLQARSGDLFDESTSNVMEEILRKAVVKYVLLDWKNFLDENDQPLPYSKEAAYKLLSEYREVFNDVVTLAGSLDNFRLEAKEDAEKNSESASGGNSSGDPT